MKRCQFVFAAVVLSLWATSGTAEVIGPQAFSSATTTIVNFDNLTGGNILNPASQRNGEVPSNQYAAQGIVFNNFGRDARAMSVNFYLPYPTLLPANATSPNVAWFDEGGGNPGTGNNYLEINLSLPVYRVGFNFGLSADSRIELQLRDAGNALLATGFTSNSNLGTYLNGFIGVASDQQVAKVWIKSTRPSNNTGLNFVMDNLRFDGTPGGAQSTAASAAQPLVQLLGNAAGGTTIDFGVNGSAIQTPGNVTVSYRATTTEFYTPPAPFSFPLPLANAVQTWDVHFDGQLQPGQPISAVFKYDDSGLSLAQEQSLVLRHYTGGAWVQEQSVVDPTANTITATLYGFSPLVLAQNVPEPGTPAILGSLLAAIAAWRAMRRQKRN
ncbi:MAG: hypothetical protein IT426_16105 [Pirellulales bacterium]|nr:hypothetical protein [Pirellulales bacterium]